MGRNWKLAEIPGAIGRARRGKAPRGPPGEARSSGVPGRGCRQPGPRRRRPEPGRLGTGGPQEPAGEERSWPRARAPCRGPGRPLGASVRRPRSSGTLECGRAAERTSLAADVLPAAPRALRENCLSAPKFGRPRLRGHLGARSPEGTAWWPRIAKPESFFQRTGGGPGHEESSGSQPEVHLVVRRHPGLGSDSALLDSNWCSGPGTRMGAPRGHAGLGSWSWQLQRVTRIMENYKGCQADIKVFRKPEVSGGLLT